LALLGATIACVSAAGGLWADRASLDLNASGITERQQQDTSNRRDRENIGAGVLVGIGAVALVGSGLGFYFWRRQEPRAVAIRLAPAVGGAALSIGGSL